MKFCGRRRVCDSVHAEGRLAECSTGGRAARWPGPWWSAKVPTWYLLQPWHGGDFCFSCLAKNGNKEWEEGKWKVLDGTEEKEENNKNVVGRRMRGSEAHACSKRHSQLFIWIFCRVKKKYLSLSFLSTDLGSICEMWTSAGGSLKKCPHIYIYIYLKALGILGRMKSRIARY